MHDVALSDKQETSAAAPKTMRHDAWCIPLRQARDFSGCTKTCAMMRDVSPLRQAGDFGGCTKTCAMMHGAQPSPPTPTKQARERMVLNLLKISGLMQCPPLGFPYKEGCLIY